MAVEPASVSQAPQPLALLADRDVETLQMYAEYLRVAGYETDEAQDGREALAKALLRQPRIIVTETRLPGIDGFDLCKLLRRDQSTNEIPIIVVTASASPAEVSRAERSGASVVLTKPCLPERLLEEVRTCIAKSRELRARGHKECLKSEAEIARSAAVLERSRRIRARVPLSRAFNRHTTSEPPLRPPVLQCSDCDRPLVYQYSHVGGVSELHKEQWDYYECSAQCGTFQYRQRTRKLRRLT